MMATDSEKIENGMGRQQNQTKKSAGQLSRYISVALCSISLLMILVYSIFVEFSVIQVMTELAEFSLLLEAKDFEQRYRIDPNTPLPKGIRMAGYLGEKALPDWFKKRVDISGLKNKTIKSDAPYLKPYDAEILYLVYPYDLFDGNRLYLMETYSEEDDIPGTFRYSDNIRILLLGFGIGFILMGMLLVRFIFRHVFRSVETLGDWAKDLNHERLEAPRPDFRFQEIEQLADLIQNGVGDLHEALTREHHFLRNASHELRTPIAVLRSNIDLLDLLRRNAGDREIAVHQRIRRSIDTMQRLTDTLLWLSRKKETMPAAEKVAVSDLVEELVRENHYLLSGKEVRLSLAVEPVSLTIPHAAIRIAVDNLIRNAFQNTIRGQIEIGVTSNEISITNFYEEHSASGNKSQRIVIGGERKSIEAKKRNQGKQDRKTEDSHGFGLGILLVKQICGKLNLTYETPTIQGGYMALIKFK